MESDERLKKIAIIEIAGELFVENGFQKTTVRQICKKAGVNLNAVNYYFGSKMKLYMEVLRYYYEIGLNKYPDDRGIKKSDPPEQKMRFYIHSIMMRMFEEGSPTWFYKLVAREYTEPTDVEDILIKEFMRPSYAMLASIIEDILGEKATEKTAYLCAMSIIGQCLYFRNSPQIASRLLENKKFDKKEILEIEKHIYVFSLSAVTYYMKINSLKTTEYFN
jgi:AcrR family transcriptional regulator